MAERGGGGAMFYSLTLTTGLPELGASGQNLCLIASEYLELCKIVKSFRLRRSNKGRALVISSYKAEENFLYLVYSLTRSLMTYTS